MIRHSPIITVSLVLTTVMFIAGTAYFALASRSFKFIPLSTTTGLLASPSPIVQAVELPLLYPRVKWVYSGRGEIQFPTSNGEYITVNGYHFESEPVEENSTIDFIDYYQRELSQRGWTDTGAFAGGSNGEWFTYENDARYITVGVRIVSVPPMMYKLVVQHN